MKVLLGTDLKIDHFHKFWVSFYKDKKPQGKKRVAGKIFWLPDINHDKKKKSILCAFRNEQEREYFLRHRSGTKWE
jgi:hypothetical protein